ncbi:MAG TPA: inositol monophosphatase family protein [Anaerolineaceae bacterium]
MPSELDVAIQAARAAGALLRQQFLQPHEIELKGAGNLVTEMDRRCEQLISTMLLDTFPGDGYYGEESTRIRPDARRLWIVDPLDGTNNYAHGYPLFCVSIGFTLERQPVAGVIYNPLLDELYAAQLGKGAALNGAPIHVSQTSELGSALLASGFPYGVWDRPDDNLDQYSRLVKRSVSVRCDGSAAVDLSHTAAGRIDGYWEQEIEPWDVAAGAVILTEAGGKVSLYDGRPFDVFGRSILATNAHLHEQLLRELLG